MADKELVPQALLEDEHAIANVFNNDNIFDKYNMHDDIKYWRKDKGFGYRKLQNMIQKKYGITVNYATLYGYLVRNGLNDDFAKEERETVNTHQELINTLATVDKSLATVEAIIEEFDTVLKDENGDVMKVIQDFTKIQGSLEKLLARKESLLKTLTQQQGVIYQYINVCNFMTRVKDVVEENFGVELWELIYKVISEDFLLRELVTKIPKTTKEVKVIK